jgi:hypothetical protein
MTSLRLLRYALACAVLSSMCGCVSFNRDEPVLDQGSRQAVLSRVTNYYVKGQTGAYSQYQAGSKELRNAVINDLIIVSDSNERLWRESLKSDINVRQIALDIAGIVSASAGGVVSSTSLAKALSASSAAFQGINTAWDRRYIAEKSIDSIINAVGIERNNKKAQIIDSMKLSVDQYGISDGVRDAIEYDRLLTADVGVSAIESATASELKTSKKAVSDALTTSRGGSQP